jgi:alkaline phosphatase D
MSEPTGGPSPVIDRRTFLAGVVATALAAGCSGDESAGTPGAARPGTPPEAAAGLPPVPSGLPGDLFALGVASGDPLPDSVVLWTRLVSDPLAAGGGLPDQPLPVRWEIAANRAFDDVVASGDVVAEPALAHSVHVDASGLEPDTWYWYRFSVGDATSPPGRTRTAPGPGDGGARLRFAFASCQSYQDGYWTAHEHLAQEDIDLVVFLGDYIYEDPPNRTAVRTYRGGAPVDLEGYRRRFGEYKADPALQAAHAHVPWVCTWDDHEVENNYAGAGDGGEADGAQAARRRAAAYQAYYEHMPVRIPPPDGGAVRLYRTIGWGDLARIYVLDGRQYRADQACDRAFDLGLGCAALERDDRTMLGAEQEAWLAGELAGSHATWNVLAQQTVVTALTLPVGDAEALNLDQWDGYPAARRRLVGMLRGVDNPVVITGDLHASGVGLVTGDPDDPGAAPVAPELVGTSISSAFPVVPAGIVEEAAKAAPDVRYVDVRRRGYVVCEVGPDALEAAFRFVSTVSERRAEVSTGARWVVSAGDPEPRPA